MEAADDFIPFADRIDELIDAVRPRPGRIITMLEKKIAIFCGLRWMKAQPKPTIIRDAAGAVWEMLGYTQSYVEEWMWHYIRTGRILMKIDRRFKITDWMKLPGEAKVILHTTDGFCDHSVDHK